MLIAVFIAGLAYGQAAAEGRVVGFLEGYVGADSARAVQDLIHHAQVPPGGLWKPLVGVAVLLYAALNLFQQARTALKLVWKLPDPPVHGLGGWVRDLVLALVLVLMTGIFLLLLITSGVAVAWLADDPVLR